MIFDHDNYRKYLKDELGSRIANNSAYSLRAFAKQLGLAPSTLSEVLKGKKNISQEMTVKICKGLKLKSKESEYFRSLVQFEKAKSFELKAILHENLSRLNSKKTIADLSLDIFKVIADWHYIAILELCSITSINVKVETVTSALEISSFETTTYLERLLRLELIENKNGIYKRVVTNNILAHSVKPNGALRAFHKQMLAKASESLETQTTDERFVGSETFPFSTEKLKEAEALLEECFSKIILLSEKSKSPNAIYHLGIQFFRLTKKGGIK